MRVKKKPRDYRRTCTLSFSNVWSSDSQRARRVENLDAAIAKPDKEKDLHLIFLKNFFFLNLGKDK